MKQTIRTKHSARPLSRPPTDPNLMVNEKARKSEVVGKGTHVHKKKHPLVHPGSSSILIRSSMIQRMIQWMRDTNGAEDEPCQHGALAGGSFGGPRRRSGCAFKPNRRAQRDCEGSEGRRRWTFFSCFPIISCVFCWWSRVGVMT